MKSLTKHFPRLSCLLAVSILMVSCGKKTEPSKKHSWAPGKANPIVSEVEEYLSGQQIICEEGEACPNYIVKIVSVEKKIPKVCTGFLVNAQTVATSASCLPQLLRLKDQDCSSDVSFFMPRVNGQPEERFACAKVLQVSEILGQDPILWRNDVAFLLMKEPTTVARRSLTFSREGLENQKEYTYWAVEQQSDDKIAFIRRANCEAIHNSYINPLASKNTSPNMLFSGCVLKHGATGAPILDSNGKVRAMVSQQMDENLRKYLEDSTGLLTGPLRQMFHATNFACAPTIFDSNTEDESECMKRIDLPIIEKMRGELLGYEGFVEEKRAQLEMQISNESRFLNFTVKLINEGDYKRAEITPKCFKNVSQWRHLLKTSRGRYVYKVSFPQFGFKRTMGPNGRIGASVVDNGKVNYYLQFSVKGLKRYHRSNIHLWNEVNHLVFRNVTEVCQ